MGPNGNDNGRGRPSPLNPIAPPSHPARRRLPIRSHSSGDNVIPNCPADEAPRLSDSDLDYTRVQPENEERNSQNGAPLL